MSMRDDTKAAFSGAALPTEDGRSEDAMSEILISIVSHRHGHLVKKLLGDIQYHCAREGITVVLTLNVDEPVSFRTEDFSVPLRIIRNSAPKGFASNHNAAFLAQRSRYFCVVNPDVRLLSNPLPTLLETLANRHVAIAAPLVLDDHGHVQDSARQWPTPLTVALRVLGMGRHAEYAIHSEPMSPDFVAGVFMLISSNVFEELGGFDARYFLYFEDIDLCARARLHGYDVVLNPRTTVQHVGQRRGRKSIKHFGWHFASMTRFFCSTVYYDCLRQRKARGQEV